MTETNLDADYWENRYQSENAPWDLGKPSRPLAEYIDQLTDKFIRILIPGGGCGWELGYLWDKGFTNIYLIDLTPYALTRISEKFPNIPKEHLILGDFFELNDKFDLILEQTFFCALDPSLRPKYVAKMVDLLADNGKLCGVLFDFPLTEKGPPFGGQIDEYNSLFIPAFQSFKVERCYNSEPARADREFFIRAIK